MGDETSFQEKAVLVQWKAKSDKNCPLTVNDEAVTVPGSNTVSHSVL